MHLLRATLITLRCSRPGIRSVAEGLHDRQQLVPEIVPLVLISGITQRRNRLLPSGEGGYLRGSDSNNYGSIYALLFSTNTYNVSWKKTVNDDYPVPLRWLFQDPGKDPVNGRNTTESFFMFRPHDIAQQLPTPLAPDLDPGTALAFAAADFSNAIEISQPGHPLASDRENAPMDLSQPFTIQDYFIKDFFQTEAANARDKEHGKWKRSVAIGVGVGVPVLMATAALVGWNFGKKRGRRVVAKQ